ncbi:MAG TPA: hypothetical protein VKQ36_00760, partial [Ktedonobacterales bacterium]|nr:hypothetical protein [Ktedonobacterales bacterium]
MSQTPSYYVNSPVSGTQYYAPMGYGCIPNNGSILTCVVKAWSGPNGTGSLVSVSSITAYTWDQTSNSAKNSFTFSGGNNASASTTSFNGTDWAKPSGKYTGGSIGSLEMYLTYTGQAFIPTGITFTPNQGSGG